MSQQVAQVNICINHLKINSIGLCMKQSTLAVVPFRRERLISRRGALSLESLSITQAVQLSVISKTNGGTPVASFQNSQPPW